IPKTETNVDVCHFCTKRVYVMERLSAEGYFFHRECFRCDVCKCTLRLGGHTFDSQEGELFYGNCCCIVLLWQPSGKSKSNTSWSKLQVD
uniref:LIM zinc-binding domain-containing protein n=1 Tax=Cynoglossus semilaevis TaxID=244447 RepID=A0A3P8X677_CYNSE